MISTYLSTVNSIYGEFEDGCFKEIFNKEFNASYKEIFIFTREIFAKNVMPQADF